MTDLALGDRVVVAAPGHFKAYECVPAWACQKLRDNEDFAVSKMCRVYATRLQGADCIKTACTLMIVFGTALYGLQDRANLQIGEVQYSPYFPCHMPAYSSLDCSDPLRLWRRWPCSHSDCEDGRRGDLRYGWYSREKAILS